MKQTLITLIFLLTYFVGYSHGATYDLIKEERILSPFKKLEITKGIEVFISQGDSTRVLIEATEDILSSVLTEVHGETLKLSIDDRYKRLQFKESKVIIYLTTPSITSIYATKNSIVTVSTAIKSENLSINIFAGAKINFEKSITIDNKLSIASNSSGMLFVKGQSSAKSVLINAASASKIEINMQVEESIEFFATGRSKIVSNGKAIDAMLSTTTESEIRMKGFEVQRANVLAASKSVIQITVKETLAATATNASVINYWGKPKTVSKETTLGGRIR